MPKGDATSAVDDLARQRLAAIVESSDDAIVSKDLNGIITSWNRSAERLFGYTAAEAIGKSILLIIPPERQAEETEVLARVRSGRSVDHFETVRVRKDGSRIDVSITVSPMRNAAGIVVGASKIARDITERVRIDALRVELLESERAARMEAIVARDRLAFLAEVSALLASSLDYEETLDKAVHLALPRLGDYCSVFVSDEGKLRLLACGHVVREREGFLRSLAERFVSQDAGVPTFTAEVARTGQPRIVPRVTESKEFKQATKSQDVHHDLVRQANTFRPCSFVGIPLIVRRRTVGVMSFGTTDDLSAHEYSAEDLPLIEEFARRVSVAIENARLYRDSAELNRLKDEFLATVSHELRTPLNAILGWSRLLAGGQLTGDNLRRALVSIERNATAQAKLVDDILDTVRGIAGHLRLEPAPIDLAELAQRGIDGIAPAASARKLTLELRSPGPVPLVGDAGRLQQVIGNLLGNAVKFTPEGGRISVEVRAADWAELRVADSGIGIDPGFMPHVFDKFRQADGSFTRPYGGLGLGLAIARHIVELHGGTIEVQSAGKNKGSMFTVRLPLDGPPPS